jgi:hypothetical protein
MIRPQDVVAVALLFEFPCLSKKIYRIPPRFYQLFCVFPLFFMNIAYYISPCRNTHYILRHKDSHGAVHVI